MSPLKKRLARQTDGAAVELPPEPADIPSLWRAYKKSNLTAKMPFNFAQGKLWPRRFSDFRSLRDVGSL